MKTILTMLTMLTMLLALVVLSGCEINPCRRVQDLARKYSDRITSLERENNQLRRDCGDDRTDVTQEDYPIVIWRMPNNRTYYEVLDARLYQAYGIDSTVLSLVSLPRPEGEALVRVLTPADVDRYGVPIPEPESEEPR